jgi:hypothetical protein
MRLSKHFIENWHERVGNFPKEGMVKSIIQDSIRVQKGIKLMRPDGSPFSTLTLYWHPDLKLILQIDCFNDTAVSVLSDKNGPGPCKRQASAQYTPMTMHSY